VRKPDSGSKIFTDESLPRGENSAPRVIADAPNHRNAERIFIMFGLVPIMRAVTPPPGARVGCGGLSK
jgi:hypothetical protein